MDEGAQRLAKGQPKRSVGCPAETALFAAGVNLSNLLGAGFIVVIYKRFPRFFSLAGITPRKNFTD